MTTEEEKEEEDLHQKAVKQRVIADRFADEAGLDEDEWRAWQRIQAAGMPGCRTAIGQSDKE